MVRGLYELRKEREQKLKMFLQSTPEGQSFHISGWHVAYKKHDGKLLAKDEFSLNVLREFTSEEWRSQHAHNHIEEDKRIDFFR